MPRTAPSPQLLRVQSEIEAATGHSMVRAGLGFKGVCPQHDDQKASLSLRDDYESGRVRMNCHAGCDYLEISQALGLTKNDFLYPTNGHKPNPAMRAARQRDMGPEQPGPTGREIASYAYQDVTGHTLYYNVRYEPKDFRMRAADGRASVPRTVPRVPYNLPAVIAAVARGETVYWVEGEKDVASLARLGLVGTTCAGGAQAKIEPDWEQYFDGADLVVIADLDAVGKSYARRVANVLVNATVRTRIAWPAIDKPKSDLTDHLDAGFTIDQLDWQPANAVRRTSFNLDQIEAVPQIPMRWLVPGMIPQGSGLVLLVGAPKAGKSWFNLNLVMAIASGQMREMFDWGEDLDPAPCLYLALEDNAQRLSRRWQQMKGNVTIGPHARRNTEIWTDLPPLSSGGEDKVRGWLDRHPDARCVIVDVLAKVREDGGDGGNSYQLDYQAIGVLKEIADEYGVTVVVTHHDRKKKHDGDFFDQISGTKGITGAADTVLYLKRTRGSDEGQIEVSGRDVEEAKFVMQFVREQGRWLIVSQGEIESASEDGSNEGQFAARPDALPQTIQVALEQSNGPLSAREIAVLLGASSNSVQKALTRLRESGIVQSAQSRGKWEPVSRLPADTTS